MTSHAKEITPISIEHEMKQSYLDYAMSVIVGRALPDARDGLKPVHRRVLFAMQQLGNDWNKPYKKSARIVGDVIGKYHPHGDTAVYDTIVRMAQPFSLRYMLVDGQGNFGSIDGDSPAAMRYTEIRMSKVAHSLLADLEKETVDYVPNYDGTENIPTVLPTRVPNLLVNGSSGIAVGMATNIPPHNLSETIDACIALIEDPDITIETLMQHIPGPDFPTAGIINGKAGILNGYRTGRGRVVMRARTDIETHPTTQKQSIIVNELPYQVNKARLLERIGELVKEKQIEGITAIRDESDRQGMRVVVEVRRGENAEVILNQLYTQTQLQLSFGINMVALDQGQPRLLNLKQLLESFISHRREVVTRRTIFELRKARERAHLLEGLAVALANIDKLVELIKSSASPQVAKERLLAEVWSPGLVTELLQNVDSNASRPSNLLAIYGLSEAGYRLSPEQAQAILDLRLHRLTGLETDKIHNEYKELMEFIKELLHILSSPERLLEVIKEELIDIKLRFGDARRTEIRDSEEDFSEEDLIADEPVVITLSKEGYIKAQPLEDYQAQRRGGKGRVATQMKQEDLVERLVVADTHDTLLCFSNTGRVYWLKAYRVPQASRMAKGRPLVNLLSLGDEERISAILALRNYGEDQFILMSTAQGTIKKMDLSHFARPRTQGIFVVSLLEGDQLVDVAVTDGDAQVMLFSDAGKVVRFHEDLVRPIGRSGRGVRGIRLKADQKLISMVVTKPDAYVLAATENGYGKRTLVSEYRESARGGQGMIAMRTSERNGRLVGALEVAEDDELMLISSTGKLVRTRVSEIPTLGRNTQGVKLIRLNENENLVGLQKVVEAEDGVSEEEL